jgi:hypothetical protein
MALSSCCLVVASSVAMAQERAAVENGAAAAANEKRWSVTLDSEVRFFTWKSNLSFPPGNADPAHRGSGTQVYIPYGLQFVGQPHDDLKIELVGRGGWVRSRQTSGDRQGDVKTITDTAVSATMTYLGIEGVQPFAAVNFNVPTGKPALFGVELNTRVDPDLVEISSFGEGFNYGPTLGFTLAMAENLTTTFSAGYTNRGAFQREGTPTPGNPFALAPASDPGEVITGTVTLGHQLEKLTSAITVTGSTETHTKIVGLPQFRAGNRFSVTGNWSFAWPDVIGVTSWNFSWSHSNRNKILYGDTPTSPYNWEPFNSNSNLYKGGIEHMFPLGDHLTVGPMWSYLYRDNNGYDSGTLQFVPAKTRQSLGAQARLKAGEHVTFSARVERVRIHEKETYPGSPFSVLTQTLQAINGIPEISSSGWQGAIGASAQF